MRYTIGIDPHKRSHTAVAVDEAENEIARRRVIAGPNQVAELTGFASTLDGECRWAIEAATAEIEESGTLTGRFTLTEGEGC